MGLYNYYSSMLQNLKEFMDNDELAPFEKYGIAPAAYIGTDPRYNKRPESQATSASKRNSSMAPNIQAGITLYPERIDDIELDYPITGEVDDIEDMGHYRQDPRVVLDNQRNDIVAYGYPVVRNAGAESFQDSYSGGPYDRDPGEVNTPVVFGTIYSYQGSAEAYTNSPMQELGSSAFGPRASQYESTIPQESNSAHPGHDYIQPHRNAITHTVDHDHPFNHEDGYYPRVEYATSIGDRGVR